MILFGHSALPYPDHRAAMLKPTEFFRSPKHKELGPAMFGLRYSTLFPIVIKHVCLHPLCSRGSTSHTITGLLASADQFSSLWQRPNVKSSSLDTTIAIYLV